MLPRDDETREEFERRLQTRERLLSEKGYSRLTEIFDGKKVEELYGFSPKGIWCFFSKGKLPFWYGAMTWIMDDGTPIIQFQKKFATKTSFLGYSIEEVGTHEALHAFRSDFVGDRFEEIFAYQASRGWLRRYLGPLFRSPWETWTFFITLLPPWFSLFGCLVPVAFLEWRGIRLVYDYKLFCKALEGVRQLFPEAKKPLALLVRMKEEEILLFAKGYAKNYVERQTSLRWQQIREIGMGRT